MSYQFQVGVSNPMGGSRNKRRQYEVNFLTISAWA